MVFIVLTLIGFLMKFNSRVLLMKNRPVEVPEAEAASRPILRGSLSPAYARQVHLPRLNRNLRFLTYSPCR